MVRSTVNILVGCSCETVIVSERGGRCGSRPAGSGPKLMNWLARHRLKPNRPRRRKNSKRGTRGGRGLFIPGVEKEYFPLFPSPPQKLFSARVRGARVFRVSRAAVRSSPGSLGGGGGGRKRRVSRHRRQGRGRPPPIGSPRASPAIPPRS